MQITLAKFYVYVRMVYLLEFRYGVVFMAMNSFIFFVQICHIPSGFVLHQLPRKLKFSNISGLSISLSFLVKFCSICFGDLLLNIHISI